MLAKGSRNFGGRFPLELRREAGFVGPEACCLLAEASVLGLLPGPVGPDLFVERPERVKRRGWVSGMGRRRYGCGFEKGSGEDERSKSIVIGLL